MAVSAFATGTQAASISTEHFLSSPNAAGSYQLYVDVNAMAAGDATELRVYTIVLTGGTARVVDYGLLVDAQPADNMIARSIVVSTELTDTNAIRFSLKQIAGTGRSYPWKVLSFA